MHQYTSIIITSITAIIINTIVNLSFTFISVIITNNTFIIANLAFDS